ESPARVITTCMRISTKAETSPRFDSQRHNTFRRTNMRKVTFGGANSLDDFFARKDDSVDWLLWGEEVSSISAKFWKTVDTVVMGRRTYEAALRLGTTSYPGVKNYVCSRTLKESPDEKVEIIATDAAEFVRQLKNQEGKDI